MTIPLLTSGPTTAGTTTAGTTDDHAAENPPVNPKGITTEPSCAGADNEDDSYSSIRVDDPGQIDGLLRRYDRLLHEISVLDHQIQSILKELVPPVSLPA